MLLTQQNYLPRHSARFVCMHRGIHLPRSFWSKIVTLEDLGSLGSGRMIVMDKMVEALEKLRYHNYLQSTVLLMLAIGI